jgi:hypothetical protein
MNNQYAAMFSGTGAQAPGQGGNYIRPGEYLCRIDLVRPGITWDGQLFTAIDITVLASQGPTAGITENDKQLCSQPGCQVICAPMSEGEQVSSQMMKKHASFAGNYSQFFYAASGLPFPQPDHVTASAADLGQPLRGRFIAVSAHMILTQKNKKAICKVHWGRTFSAEELRSILPPSAHQYLAPLPPITPSEWGMKTDPKNTAATTAPGGSAPMMPPGSPAWGAPPAQQQPAWGAQPPAQQQPAPAWGAPQPPAQPPAWGAPPAQPQQQQPPAWGAPPAQQQQPAPAWGAPQPPAQPQPPAGPAWSAPQPQPPGSAPAAVWGAPQQPQAPAWGSQPPAAPGATPPAWGQAPH